MIKTKLRAKIPLPVPRADKANLTELESSFSTVMEHNLTPQNFVVNNGTMLGSVRNLV